MNNQTTEPNRTRRRLVVFCDGGARGNPGPAAVGFLVKNGQGKVLVKKGEYIGRATNNVAEYQAVVKALEWLNNNQDRLNNHQNGEQNNKSTIEFFLDSQLVVNQLNGYYKIKNASLRRLIIKVKGLENQLDSRVFYQHISREKNKQADKLLNIALNKHLA